MSELTRRIEAPLRGARRRIVRALPADRRIKGLGGAKGRGWLQARRLVAPLMQRPVTLSTRAGLKLRVSADPVDEQIAQHVLGPHRTQYFPPWPHGAPHAPCILDVGAHHGLYAAAALHEYPGSRVVCVEPSAEALPMLRANLDLNGFASRARIVNTALAPAAGEATLQHAADGSWGYSLYEDAESSTGSEVVSLATLDEILAGASPEIVKCNAEGAEYSLIEQIERTAVRPMLMIVMVHPQFGDMAQLVARAEAMGYRVDSVGWEARPAFQMWRTG
ncbi:MAG TPA: FkbM family methyltransferase [Acidimicrobiia bacterium]|jgi:FkbM family methyltransferase|nr:FkbM family methyltransferase [Acidimicrobiia bacterium]